MGRRLALAALGARLPQAMTGVALMLFMTRRHGVPAAGTVLACHTLACGAMAPVHGRLVDRAGARGAVPTALAAYAVATALFVGVAGQRRPGLAAFACAALVGLTTPPLVPAVRALWTRYGDASARRAGLALDAVLFDASLILGPMLAAALVAVRPAFGPGAVVLITAAGAWALLSIPNRSAQQTRDSPSTLLGPFRSRSYAGVPIVMVFASAAIAAVAVGLPLLAERDGAHTLSGPLVAAFSAGSIIGGIAWARRGSGVRGERDKVRSFGESPAGPLAALSVTLTVLPVSGGDPWLLLAAAPPAGLPVAIVLGSLSLTASRTAPSDAATEAQSWLITANTFGSAAAALGQAALLARDRTEDALVLPAILAATACLVAVVVRERPGRLDSRGTA